LKPRSYWIKKPVTPQVWRATRATHFVQDPANLRHVQDLPNHRSLATTERNLRQTITDLKEAHAKCRPREREKPSCGAAGRSPQAHGRKMSRDLELFQKNACIPRWRAYITTRLNAACADVH